MRRIITFFISVILLGFLQTSFSQVNVQANSYLEVAKDTEEKEEYFEEWTDLYLGYKNWRVGLRYEFHRPPFPFNTDLSSWNDLTQRFIEYRTANLSVTLGHFYTLLGRGLVLRSFENRILRWDNNLDGAKIEYFNSLFELKLLAGKPRDPKRNRGEWLKGGSINLKPLSFFNVGATFLDTKWSNDESVRWGSVFAGLTFDYGDVYFERAFRDFPEEMPEGKAYFGGSNLYFGNFNAQVEYRYYKNFALVDGLLQYNNPPTVYREHLYTLLNRHQLVQDADDERGYMVQLSYTLGDLGVWTVNHSRTKNSQGDTLYLEYYTQLDLDPTPDLNLVAGGGYQRDASSRYLNFVTTAKWAFADAGAIKAIFEHQHAKVLLTERQFYNQAYTISYDHGGYITLSVLAERSTDQLSEKDFWIGGQADVHLPYNFDVTLFGGSRRKGKICAGGVCIERPAFEGVEMRLQHRF
ncbi:MAG: hypothetical protein Kow0037_01170 [Calditrichia bacterium]